VATDRGTIIIKTDHPDIEVAVKQDGKLIVILDKQTGKEFVLRSGTYELELVNGKEGLKLETNRLVLKRGDKRIVEVIADPTAWVTKAPMLAPCSSCMAGVIDGRIYIVGGRVGQASLPSVQAYDPATNQWDYQSEMPRTDAGEVGRDTGSAVVIDGKLHVL